MNPNRDNANAPLAVDARQLGEMLCLSVRTIRTMDSAGKLPKPVTLACRSVRWNVAEICDWLDAGAPARIEWQAIRTHGKRPR